MKKISFLILIAAISLLLVSCQQEPATLKVGEPAPNFSLTDRQGKVWTLSELKGRVVFINFWATWCSPCLTELPSMQKLYEALPKDRFVMLAILNNDKPAMADFVTKSKNITIPVLDDGSNTVGSAYFLTGLPETFVVDKQGILRHKVIGGEKWDAPKHIQMMQDYMNEPATIE